MLSVNNDKKLTSCDYVALIGAGLIIVGLGVIVLDISLNGFSLHSGTIPFYAGAGASLMGAATLTAATAYQFFTKKKEEEKPPRNEGNIFISNGQL